MNDDLAHVNDLFIVHLFDEILVGLALPYLARFKFSLQIRHSFVFDSPPVLVVDFEWLEAKYHRQADNRNDEDKQLKGILGSGEIVISPHGLSSFTAILSLAQFERNVDHGGDDGGRILGRPFVKPLIDNQKIHISEEQDKEDKLRDGLEDNVSLLLPDELITGFKQDAEGHVDNSDDHCDFHLETVCELKLVCRDRPDWIHSDGVDAVGFRDGSAVYDLVTTAENVEVHREELVVD
jgi:hypothetical protein